MISDLQMLDIAPASDSPCSRMPLDFTPYLLSASPPASTFDFHSYSPSSSSSFASRFPPFVAGEERESKRAYGVNTGTSLKNRRHAPLKSIIIRPDNMENLEEEDLLNSEGASPMSSAGPSSAASSDGECTPTSPSSPGRIRKKVSFADNVGMPLAEVRLMREGSDEPPRIPPQLLACITQGATAGVTDKPPLKLTFTQPASDYLSFRDKIDKNCVSLENVLLRDYMVQGTVKVKNISFEKTVFIRYTNNSWESHTDVPAIYVPGPGEVAGRPNVFDTFQFEFEVPPSSDLSKSVEFAVCFEASGQQYWDSNSGANYAIVWETFSEPPNSIINNASANKNPFIFGPSDLASFACWNHTDPNIPYY